MKKLKRFLVLLLIICIGVTSVAVTPVEVMAYEEPYPLPELTGNQAQDVANIAISQLGYKRDSTGTVYGAWWNTVTDWGYDYTNEAWCGMFACWCAYQAGAGLGVAYDKNSAYTPAFFNFLKANGTYDNTFTTDPQVGDFIFFGAKEGRIDHVAIVIGYDPETKLVTVVGGNQGSSGRGAVTQGVCTWKEDSPWGSKVVKGYGRPNYTYATSDYAAVGSVEAIVGGDNCIEIKGFAYDPDKPEASVNIDVYVNDNYVATKEVNNNFEVIIPYKVAENGEYEVKVYAKDVNKVFDDTLLEGCPQSVTIIYTPFDDVASSSYYYIPVIWAVDKEVTLGVSPTLFNPQGECTRAQAITFLWRVMGCPESTMSECPFEDIAEGSYYEKAVHWAYENNISIGKDEQHFSPDDAVTRAEMLAFLWRLEGESEPNISESPFEDVVADQYYEKAVLWAYENDITTGTDNNHFAPDAYCLREHVVTFLYRMYA